MASVIGLLPSARARGQACEHGLRGSHVGYGKLLVALNVLISVVARCADEAEVILPAHRDREMLGREIVAAICLAAADDDERENREKTFPDRLADIQLDQMRAFGVGHASIPLLLSDGH
jgi:hypothetical protein